MRLYRKLTALLVALSLILSISPFTASLAEGQAPLRSLPERETIPEYTQALEKFEVEYEQQLAYDRRCAESTPEPVATDSNDITENDAPGIMPMSLDEDGDYVPESVDSGLQIRSDDYESVSLGNGALNFTYPILSLKGKNGMDVNLSLQYNSAEAVNDAPEGALYTGVAGKPQDYYDWGIGMGWSFTAPRINKNSIDLPDGSSLPLRYISGSIPTPYISNASNSEWARKDIFMSGYTIRTKDGSSISNIGTTASPKYRYRDRFGNEIIYTYSGSKLTSIVDTLGRTIRFTYADNLITVTLDNEVCCKIYRDKSNFGMVTRVANALGDKTSFEYEKLTQSVSYTGGGQDIAGPSRTYYIDSYNMTKVTYPTGGYSVYGYSAYNDTTTLIPQRPRQYYRYTVSSIVRDDHLIRYTYTRTNVSGTYTSYISKITENDNQKLTEYELARSANILKKTVTIPESEFVTESQYNSADLPIRRTVTINGNADTQTVETWQYEGTVNSMYSNVTKYVDPLGNWTEATYNFLLLPVTKKIYSPDGTLKLSTANTFPTSGSLNGKQILSSTTNTEGIVTSTDYTYDEYGQVTSETATEQGKGSITTQYGYNYTQKSALPWTVTVKNVTTNSESFQPTTYDNVTEYTYDNADRTLTEKVYTDANNSLTTSYEYYADGLTKKVTAPDSSAVEYAYTLQNGGADRSGTDNTILTTMTGTDGSRRQIKDICDWWGRVAERKELENDYQSATLAKYTYWYGLIRSVEDQYGVKTLYDTDKLERVTKVTYNDETSVNIYYDDENLKSTVYNQLGVPYTTVYDKYGRKVREETVDGERTVVTASYTYDWRSLPITVTDALGNETTNYYDGVGRVTKVKDALDQETAYEYGFGDRITKTTTPGGSVFETEYDTLGNVTQTKDALGNYEYFAYNRLGNVVKAQDKNGAVTTTSYLTGTQLPSRVEKTKTGEPAEGTAYTYNGFGEVASKTNLGNNSSISYTYRYNGQPETITTGGKTLRYDYNAKGQLWKVTDYFGAQTTYEYDTLGRVSGITQDGRKTSYTYDAAGQATGVSFGGIYTASYEYNDNGTLASLENKHGQTQINRFTYTYDDNGNQLSKVEVGKSAETYTYDALGRLETVAVADALTTYSYDANGNIASVSSPGSTITNTYDAQNMLLKRVSATADATETTRYNYDANGNLYSEASYTQSQTVGEESVSLGTVGGNNAEGVGKTAFYGYNKLNQLVSYESESAKASYSYNADGLRESKTVDGKTTQYYYNGAFVINESENGSQTATNLLGVNSIIGRKAGAETAYFAKNGHGDVTKAIGLDGTVKAAYETDVWGEVTSETGTFDNPIRYAGEYYDAESGNIYLRARYYDSSIGRFISEDPIGYGFNWYIYCNNNPIKYIDPSGLIITLVGSEDEMQRSFDQLQALTNDELTYDKETGVVTIVNTGTMNTDKTLASGSQMVADLIANDDFNTKIERINAENEGCYVWYEDGGATVQMNDWTEAGGNWFYEVSDGAGGTAYDDHKNVAHIILGHELIHATHHMNGTLADPSRTVYRYTNTGLVADIRDDLNVSEEYNTVGLYHIVEYPAVGDGIAIRRFYIPWPGSLTENTLRAEHGLTNRTAY